MPPDTGELHTRLGELFPYELPFSVARVAGLFVLAIFAVVAAAAVLVDLPETVDAPFVMLPESGADPVESAFDGVLDTVRATTRQTVQAGDVLFMIRSPRVQTLSAELRTLEEDRAALAVERTALEEKHRIGRDIQLAEINQREREITFRKQYLDVYADVRRRMEALGDQGLTSSVDLLIHQLGHAEAERDLALAEEQLKMAQLNLNSLDAEHAQASRTYANEEAKLNVRIESLHAQLAQTEGDFAVVKAPYDGIIVRVTRRRPGDVVRVGQELCQLSPIGAPLRAYLQLEERGMARLREGQAARLLFEAFPYQRYGVIDGTLEWLSPASINDGEARAFVGHVVPEHATIGPAGREQAVRAGMQGTARVQVGRRTLIEYAFEPIRRLRENLRDQQPDLTQ
jgi:multidrug resistance efflux pump